MPADTGDAKITWSVFIRNWLAIRSWDQMQLVRQSGGKLNYKTVNKWYQAQAAASSDMAVVTAQILNAPLVEALRAAGHVETAAAIEGRQSTDGPQTPAPAELDPGIAMILAADLLSDSEKADFIRHYQDELRLAREQAEARARRMVQTVEETRRSS